MVRPDAEQLSNARLIALSSGSAFCFRILGNLCRHPEGIFRHRHSRYHEGELRRCVSGVILPNLLLCASAEFSKLLEETLDAGGRPLTTSPNALRDIVLPPSLLSKLLSVAGANINTSFNTGAGGPFSSPIPWRKANVRHNANEIYFDMVEELSAIVNKYVSSLAALSILTDIETGTVLLFRAPFGERLRPTADYQVCFVLLR